MGGVVSHLQDGLFLIAQGVKTTLDLGATYHALLKRARSDPGLPVAKPTSSYWMQDPSHPELLEVEDDLPKEADVVIIGSGITSAAAARTICEVSSKLPSHGVGEGGLGRSPTIVILEARQLCSGATARNGGHIKCAPYSEYSRLTRQFGADKARKIVAMQLRSLGLMVEVGGEIPEGEVRRVDTVDLFIDREAFEDAKLEVEALRGAMPDVAVAVWESEACERFGVNEHVVGAVSYAAGALWPFRLVTGVWHQLVRDHANVSISTHTPVEAIREDGASDHPFTVQTRRGHVRARHVLHATNGHAGHLLPGLRGCLTGAIGHMTAQRPGGAFPAHGGSRSWSVMYRPGFDYVTQRPDGADGSQGDIMLGGALFRSQGAGLDQVGVWDDGGTCALPLMHLRGSMATLFEPRWGVGGELRRAWTGIMGFTGDMLPLVGPLQRAGGGSQGARQWIAAGYNGEGMVWAWLSGTAVALMMLGAEGEDLEPGVGRPGGRLADWYPVDEVAVNAARLRRADLKNLQRWA